MKVCDYCRDVHRYSHRCSQGDLCLSVNIVNENTIVLEKIEKEEKNSKYSHNIKRQEFTLTMFTVCISSSKYF